MRTRHSRAHLENGLGGKERSDELSLAVPNRPSNASQSSGRDFAFIVRVSDCLKVVRLLNRLKNVNSLKMYRLVQNFLNGLDVGNEH
jgi:hypothetical protein